MDVTPSVMQNPDTIPGWEYHATLIRRAHFPGDFRALWGALDPQSAQKSRERKFRPERPELGR